MFVHRRTSAWLEEGSRHVFRVAGVIWCLTAAFSWLRRAALRSATTATRSDHLRLAPGWAVGKTLPSEGPKAGPSSRSQRKKDPSGSSPPGKCSVESLHLS